MEKRICKYCGEEHPIKFYELANIIKGVEYRRWKCKNCYRDAKKARLHKIRDWWNDLKKSWKCKECGENRYYMLDLHHRDPNEKDINLGDAVGHGWSRKRILEEASKCDIYCANHHRELHYKEKQLSVA